MIDLDELERLHKAATPEPDALDTIRLAAICDLETTGNVTLSADDWRVVEDLARIGRHACDDGLLQRLRTAERERDEAQFKLGFYANSTSIAHRSWNGFNIYGDSKSISEVARLENIALQVDIYRATFDASLAALKAENERLREALAEIDRRHIPDQPAGYGGDEVAWAQRHVGTLRGIARTALETAND